MLNLLTLNQEVWIKWWSWCMREGSCIFTAPIILHPEGFTWFSLKGELWDVRWDCLNKIIYCLLEFIDFFIFDPEESDFAMIKLEESFPFLYFVFAPTFHDIPWWQLARVVKSRSTLMNFWPRSVKSRWIACICVKLHFIFVVGCLRHIHRCVHHTIISCGRVFYH